MDNLKKLLEKCKCGVYIQVNSHRDYYMTAEQQLKELEEQGQIKKSDIDPEMRTKMIELNTIIEVQFYPDTPVGSYSIYHYDIEDALKIALECIS